MSRIEHFYETIKGSFDFQEVYKRAVKEAPDQAHFVEVGTSHGQSAAFLAVEIINSGKQITLDLVDIWGKWNKNSPTPDTVKTNLAAILDKTQVNLTQQASAIAAESYDDLSLDFVFIDANHDYYNVQRDIIKWLPRLKRNAILAGHDYTREHPGVQEAVRDLLRPTVEIIGNSWWYYSS